MAAARAGIIKKTEPYYFVGFIQAHALVPVHKEQRQTRTQGPSYGNLDMKVLSIPGKHYISGQMGPIYDPPESDPHWEDFSTDAVFPGVLREEFAKISCDNKDEIDEAFDKATERLREIYEAADIDFPDGGFTPIVNPHDHRLYQLHRNPGEQKRSDDSKLKGRAAAGDYQPVPENGYGFFCICTNHPLLQDLCLTALSDAEVTTSVNGVDSTHFIPANLFPKRNMIGKTDIGTVPKQLGARYWKDAIERTDVPETLKKRAYTVIDKAWTDRTIQMQDLIHVLEALGIDHAWLFDPSCRDLDEDTTPRKPDEEPSPPHKPWPDSMITDLTQSQSQSISASPSPSPSPARGSRPGGSRKSRKRTTLKRKKNIRKTKKRAYKNKSQKRNGQK